MPESSISESAGVVLISGTAQIPTSPATLTELPQTPVRPSSTDLRIGHELDDSGVYQASDSAFHAFVNDSPKSELARREKTQVDLRLPSLAAFSMPGKWFRSLFSAVTD